MTPGPVTIRLPRGAVVAVLAGLLLKLALLLGVHTARPGGVVYIDTGTYVRPARELLSHCTFFPNPGRAPERSTGPPASLS